MGAPGIPQVHLPVIIEKRYSACRKITGPDNGKSTADDRQCFFAGFMGLPFFKGVYIITSMITIVNKKFGINRKIPVIAGREGAPFLLHGCNKTDTAA